MRILQLTIFLSAIYFASFALGEEKTTTKPLSMLINLEPELCSSLLDSYLPFFIVMSIVIP